jgi:hypothetical protein
MMPSEPPATRWTQSELTLFGNRYVTSLRLKFYCYIVFNSRVVMLYRRGILALSDRLRGKVLITRLRAPEAAGGIYYITMKLYLVVHMLISAERVYKC